MKSSHCLCVALFSLLLTGCVSFTPTGPLGDPVHKAATPLAQAALIEQVSVTDSSLDATRQQDIGKQLTAQLNHYVERGEFAEQTVFVVTNNPPTKRKGDDEINRKGHFASNPTGLEVSVKDSERFASGMENLTLSAPMDDIGGDGNLLVLFGNRRQVEMTPALLPQQLAREVIFMQALHDENDCAFFLVIKA